MTSLVVLAASVLIAIWVLETVLFVFSYRTSSGSKETR
jgi:hypothetical protein